MTKTLPVAATVLTVSALMACGGGSSAATMTSPSTASTTTTTTTGGTTTVALSATYAHFRSAVTVSSSGSTISLQSRDVPDHPSPYWGVGNSLYEAPQPGMQVNPNTIVALVIRTRASS